MEIGRVFIVTLHAGFDGLRFVFVDNRQSVVK